MKGPAGHRRVVERGGAHSQATRLPVQAEVPCGPAVPRGHVSDGGRWEASSGGDGVRGEGGAVVLSCLLTPATPLPSQLVPPQVDRRVRFPPCPRLCPGQGRTRSCPGISPTPRPGPCGAGLAAAP